MEMMDKKRLALRLMWVAVGLCLAVTGCSVDQGTGDGDASADVAMADTSEVADSSDGLAEDGAEDGAGDGTGPGMDATPPPRPACVPGAAWSPGTSLFVERTQEWGLTGVEGEYLTVTDMDGDGWADLIARNGGGPDDFSPGGERSKYLLRNRGDGTFEDQTQSSGIFASREMPDPLFGASAKVVATGDVDNDGDLDVFIGRSRLDPWAGVGETSELMLNNGDGTFTLGPEESDARSVSKPSNPAGITFVDYNRDGWLDLWVVHNETSGPLGMQDRLLRGDGTGAFEDVTQAAGLSTTGWSTLEKLNTAVAHTWGWGSTACDLDNDGWPELLAASYGRMANHLWQGGMQEGEVVFDNASISSGYAFDERTDWTTNLSAQCYCKDEPTAEDCDLCPAPADPNICTGLANAFGPNYRWNHDTGRQPFSLGGVTGTTVCTDINNDGHLDLMNYEIVHGDVGESADPTEILVNAGGDSIWFERPGPQTTGIYREESSPFWDHGDMTGAVFDMDNDGWQDVYIGSAEYAGTRGFLYRQKEPMVFETVSDTDGFLHWRAHGVTVADFDQDGDLDIVVGHSHHRCEGFWDTECAPTKQIRFFENVFGQQNNWLRIQLIGTGPANAAAIGARVTVEAGEVTQTHVVDGGHGRFGLQGDLTQVFGLGAACDATVTVLWPDAEGTVQTFSAFANATYHVTRGGAAERVAK